MHGRRVRLFSRTQYNRTLALSPGLFNVTASNVLIFFFFSFVITCTHCPIPFPQIKSIISLPPIVRIIIHCPLSQSMSPRPLLLSQRCEWRDCWCHIPRPGPASLGRTARAARRIAPWRLGERGEGGRKGERDGGREDVSDWRRCTLCADCRIVP